MCFLLDFDVAVRGESVLDRMGCEASPKASRGRPDNSAIPNQNRPATLEAMDPNYFLVALLLVVLFASISVVGALHRIRNASEETLAILREQAAEKTLRE